MSKPGASDTLGKAQRKPAYCLGGIRHRDGVTLAQASVRNVRTCRPNVKGEAQVEDPRGESTDVGHRGGTARSACLAAHLSGGLKSHSARGPGLISESGGNSSLAETHVSEDRALTARWGLKGLRRTTGS